MSEKGVIESRPTVSRPSTALSGRALWLSFAAATTGTFMVNVDASVVNVALPVLQHQFQLPISTLQWVITGYLLIITALLPMAGYLADALGRREVFMGGVLVFTLGSLASALAPNFSGLVAARVLQGIGGATIMANVMAIIALIFPVQERGRALGLIGSVVAAGTLAGPPLGGLLTAWYGWRSIFWINLPVGLWGLWGSWRYLPHFPPDPHASLKRFDWAGAGLFMATTSLLQFGLADLHHWTGLAFLAADGVSLAAFIRIESRNEHPLIPLRLFRVRAFSFNMLAGMAYWVLMMFPAFLMPFYLHTERHLPISWVGLSLVPQALAMIIVSPWGGRWADRRGIMGPGRTGLALFILADVLLAGLPLSAPLWTIWLALAIIGVAAGLFSSPQNAAVLNSVTAHDTGLASSLLATQRNLGRAVGVALGSGILSLVWLLIGAGPNPSHTDPHYIHWLLIGIRGVFWSGIGFALIGLWLLTDPAKSPGSGGKT
ncbi:MAG: DHA2 family efflux MFS transporter permease subunit [Sulfobacillus sp.]|nr:DHA2 family efflux MFS transporter permease subunit [Sulfobacillus sp.]